MSTEVKPQWRVGSKVPINVYEGDRPVCQCHTAEDAQRIVEAMNAQIARAQELALWYARMEKREKRAAARAALAKAGGKP